MRKLVLIFSLLGLIASAAAASDLYTHTTAEPERSFMVAATWWLPDYQSDTRDFAKRADGNGKVAGDIDNTCANYNKSWQTTVGADMECDAVKPLPNLTCYKNCRCKNVVSVGTGEQCNRYCNGSQCVSKSCKAGVSVGSGETCTEKCASNSNICTAKRCAATVSVSTGETCTTTCGGNCVAKSCKAGVSVATGETCTERCASNSGICTAKSCNATVSVGVGEQCTTTCGGNCVAKSCKGAVSVGTGETCTQKCASNSGVCTAKSCKSTATVNTGEYCTERCAANNSCTAKACKSAVSVGVGETCSERCAANTNTCTAKKCNSEVSVNSSTEVCTQTCASDASVCTAKRAKTCAERGMKDCNGSCIATSECCGGCPGGQVCSNGTCLEIPCEECFQTEACGSGQIIVLTQDTNPNCHKCSPNFSGGGGAIGCVQLGGKCRIACSGIEVPVGKCLTNNYCCYADPNPCQCAFYNNPVCKDGQTKQYNTCNPKLWKCEGVACSANYSTSTKSCASGSSLVSQSSNPNCKTCITCESGYSTTTVCNSAYGLETITQSSNPACKKCSCKTGGDSCICKSIGGTCRSSCLKGNQFVPSEKPVGSCNVSSTTCCVPL